MSRQPLIYSLRYASRYARRSRRTTPSPYGYHVYNAKRGPGILVSGIEAHSIVGDWKKRFAQWRHDR